MKKLLLLLIITLLFSCNSNKEKIEELEQRLEKIENKKGAFRLVKNYDNRLYQELEDGVFIPKKVEFTDVYNFIKEESVSKIIIVNNDYAEIYIWGDYLHGRPQSGPHYIYNITELERFYELIQSVTYKLKIESFKRIDYY